MKNNIFEVEQKVIQTITNAVNRLKKFNRDSEETDARTNSYYIPKLGAPERLKYSVMTSTEAFLWKILLRTNKNA